MVGKIFPNRKTCLDVVFRSEKAIGHGSEKGSTNRGRCTVQWLRSRQPVMRASSVVFFVIRSQMARLARDVRRRILFPRGRPHKNLDSPPVDPLESTAATIQQPVLQTASSSVIVRPADVGDYTRECPDLTPELVAHFFQCFDRLPQAMNPILRATSIRMTIRTVSYQLYLLPPQSRALALCIIALSSLLSFHEVVLGDGPRPESFSDAAFFSSTQDVLGCGARRAGVHWALHAEALKGAWDAGVMLQVSNENAASCFLLDVLETLDLCGISRPWANTYISHVRALAPMWRISALTPPDGGHWAGYLMAEALRATSTLSTELQYSSRDDQLLLCGPDPVSPEALLASLEGGTRKSASGIVHSSVIPCLPFVHSLDVPPDTYSIDTFHITCLARELWETITGDRARLTLISEGAAIHFLASLSLTHAILSRLLTHCETLLTAVPTTESGFLLEDDSNLIGRCATGIVLGFAGLALSLHQELESRALPPSIADIPGSSGHEQERMRLLQKQARDMAALGARE
ncbi:hypothetical protein DFH09DRAFT_1287089, partial [Mycena vulgaris]